MSALAAQARVELTLTLRRGESLLLTLGIPVLLLVFFAQVDVLPTGGGDAVDVLTPGILALAVMSTAMVGLGIATGFERHYLVLKRLGATPLGRAGLLTAKIAAVAAVEVVQLLIIVPIGLALGWDPDAGGIGLALLAVLLGTAAFAGIGLGLAGVLRGEVNLAVQNGIYVVLLLLGGILVPLSELPEGLATTAKVLPSAALGELLRDALTAGTTPAWAWLTLTVWAVAAPLAAARTFRWE
jgi:ABC-2 type transport system permease protein